MNEMNELLVRIAGECCLGEMTEPAIRVSGGFMHRLYRIVTTTGEYAIKLLNPTIMDRPEALENYDKAESLEKVLEEKGLPVVAALEINGSKRQLIDGRYYYVFPWVNGSSTDWERISVSQCEKVAGLLARIHGIKKKGGQAEEVIRHEYDWYSLARMSMNRCPEIYHELMENADMLMDAQEQLDETINNLPKVRTISNGDMDPKNVIWEGEEPRIIDLECLDYGNPYSEAYQLALQWAGLVTCDLSFEKVQSYLSAYTKESGEEGIDWVSFYGMGFAWVEWLEYNVRRALGLECFDPEERRMGIEEVHRTLNRIIYYKNREREIKRMLAKVS